MRTIGIDLAAQPKKTAACVVEWQGKRAAVVDLRCEMTDGALINLAEHADKVGIDAPFGWPDEFVEAVRAHSASEPWPGRRSDPPEDYRAQLSFRETDRRITRPGTRPLSVSADKIAVTAMRCALLLDALAARGTAVHRSGSGKLVEVYPAAGLASWGLTSKGYKRKAGQESLRKVVGELLDRVPWLRLDEQDRERCSANDDLFDSLVAALIARAAARGFTYPAPDELRERADREGWIHVPKPDSLERLADAA